MRARIMMILGSNKRGGGEAKGRRRKGAEVAGFRGRSLSRSLGRRQGKTETNIDLPVCLEHSSGAFVGEGLKEREGAHCRSVSRADTFSLNLL